MATTASYPNTAHGGYNSNPHYAQQGGYGNQQGYGTNNGVHNAVDDDGYSLNSRDGNRRSGGIKGIVAGAHGLGESFRGHFNAAIDGAMGDRNSEARHTAVAQNGEAEIRDRTFHRNRNMRGEDITDGSIGGVANTRHNRHSVDANSGVGNNRYSGTANNFSRRNTVGQTTAAAGGAAATAPLADDVDSLDGEEGTIKPRKGRVVHNNNLLNRIDPRVHPADRKAWARGDYLDPPPGRRHSDGGRLYNHNGTYLDETAGAGYDRHHNRDSRFGAGNNRSATGRYPEEQPVHNTGTMNKMDPRVDEDSRTAQYAERNGRYNGVNGNDGSYQNGQPVHRSSLLNKLDPRVDSEALAASGALSGTHENMDVCEHCGSSYNKASRRERNAHNGVANSNYDNPQSSNAGPHSTAAMNRMDPTVDSNAGMPGNQYTDRKAVPNNTYDNSQNVNSAPHASNVTKQVDPLASAEAGTQGHQFSNANQAYDTQPSVTQAGTQGHQFNNANQAYDTQRSGAEYNNPQSTNSGPHSSNLMNKLDPRVDSNVGTQKYTY